MHQGNRHVIKAFFLVKNLIILCHFHFNHFSFENINHCTSTLFLPLTCAKNFLTRYLFVLSLIFHHLSSTTKSHPIQSKTHHKPAIEQLQTFHRPQALPNLDIVYRKLAASICVSNHVSIFSKSQTMELYASSVTTPTQNQTTPYK